MNIIEHVNQGLGIVDGVISSSVLDDKEAEEIRHSYDEIVRRMNLSYLNLSVIGEFSAGKSTLINGILGIDLLKTNLLACTAVPTYIYCSEQPVLVMMVETLDGKTFWLQGLPENPLLLEEESVRKLFEYLKSDCDYTVAPDFCFNTQDVIALLTAEEHITRFLSKVLVMIPDYTLGEKTRLIDTPGIDATGEAGERHMSVTESVLRDDADGLMLVLDPHDVYTSTLERFLRANAEGFMEHSFIVINKADLIPPYEREEIQDYVHDMIESRFSVDAPVYMVSATGISDGGEWQEKFQLMMTGLSEHLKNSHEALMNKMLLSCINKVMKSTRATVTDRRKEMIVQKKALEENKPEKLESIAIVLRADMERTIEEKCYSKELSYSWYTASKNCKNSVASDLQELKSVRKIRSYASGQSMEGRINEAFSSFENALIREMEEINDIFTELYSSACKRMQDISQAILESSPLCGSIEAPAVNLKTNSDELLRGIHTKTKRMPKPQLKFTPSLARLEEARASVMDVLSKSLAEEERWILTDATSCLVEYSQKRRDICLDAFKESVPQYHALYENVASGYRLLWEKCEGEISRLEYFLMEMEEWQHWEQFSENA